MCPQSILFDASRRQLSKCQVRDKILSALALLQSASTSPKCLPHNRVFALCWAAQEQNRVDPPPFGVGFWVPRLLPKKYWVLPGCCFWPAERHQEKMQRSGSVGLLLSATRTLATDHHVNKLKVCLSEQKSVSAPRSQII